MPTDPATEFRAWATLVLASVGFLLSLSNWWRQRERVRLRLIPYEGEATDDFFYRVAAINTGNVPVVIERITIRRKAYEPERTAVVASEAATIFDISRKDEAFTLKPQEAKTFNATKDLFWGPLVFEAWTVDGKRFSKVLDSKESLSQFVLQQGKQAADILTKYHSDQRDWTDVTFVVSRALYEAVMEQEVALFDSNTFDEEAATLIAGRMKNVFKVHGHGQLTELGITEEFVQQNKRWLDIEPKKEPITKRVWKSLL